jgi:hypothetical protein
MFSIRFIKFPAVFALIVLAASACRFWQNGGNAAPTPTPLVIEELKSEVPFATAEPQVFQAEIILTANETERKTFTARNGTKRRIDYNFGAENQVINLQTDKNYLIIPNRKIYAENSMSENAAATDDWTSFLTTEWLNAKTSAKFEKLETVENLTKYRVLLDEKESSEIIIYFDEAQKIMTKQEFYSINGAQKTLNFAFELRNFNLQTDENLFSVPTDCKKVSMEELRKELSQSKNGR